MAATNEMYRPRARGWLGEPRFAPGAGQVSPTRAWVACAESATPGTGTSIAHTGVGGLSAASSSAPPIMYRPHGRGLLEAPTDEERARLYKETFGGF